ncbi:unnamed protein product [Vicia faba]|uniref:Uncharacterized protein n=1 Tax=Vicia faba TaxID=3906 RepID=A0AAV1B708_VICFA|nr:unnamed protein product [Vicia faba]
MASTLRTSSIAVLSSQHHSSPSTHSLSLTKGKSQFSVLSVATEINSPQQIQRIVSKESQRPVYPFSAIVGQDEMKLCLILNVIDPKIGGVMIMDERGIGKSTTVRSLVDLLPDIKVVAGDPYNSDPEDQEFMGVVPQNLSFHFTRHMFMEILNLLKDTQKLTRQTLS